MILNYIREILDLINLKNNKDMKPLYILKIGGSVATYKNRSGALIRTPLLAKIAESIRKAQKEKKFRLILIHGAGSIGHQLAKKYNLMSGVNGDKKKLYGSLISRLANQKLNTAITEIFIEKGLNVTPAHTSSIIIQENKRLTDCNLKIIKEALSQNYIPLLYGEMVFDTKLGMSICSGDAIAPYLAKKLKAQKIFFASDIDGIFTRDPHIHKDARLIEKVSLKDIEKNATLSKSHNIDVTSGLLGKIKSLNIASDKSIKTVEIFNGLEGKNYERALLNKKFPHTIICHK